MCWVHPMSKKSSKEYQQKPLKHIFIEIKVKVDFYITITFLPIFRWFTLWLNSLFPVSPCFDLITHDYKESHWKYFQLIQVCSAMKKAFFKIFKIIFSSIECIECSSEIGTLYVIYMHMEKWRDFLKYVNSYYIDD